MGNSLSELTATPKIREMNTYDVPEALQVDGIVSIGLVQLRAEEELHATKRARNDAMRLAYELVKQSLREVNGQAVSLADGSADQMWDKMGPQLRSLALSAYNELHAPTEDTSALFLKSRKVRVG